MAILTVGAGEQFSSIAAAVAASGAGDTVNVDAGTYTNDFVTISHDLTLQAVGGTATMVATEQPPNGKAMIDAGGPGVHVAINGFDISGVTVPDGNGAAIRYEGGALTLDNDTIHGNQDGILANADPTGTIAITNSTFANNGAGDGYTHNIYIGQIASLTVANSTITAANVGHDIKSRAASTTITNNTITDGANGNSSYEIDLPNGGLANIEGNTIQKGAHAQNPTAIAFGEEGNLYANSSLSVSGNTITNDDPSPSSTALWNATGASATLSGNSLFGWGADSSGLVQVSGSVALTTPPLLGGLVPGIGVDAGVSVSAGAPAPTDPPADPPAVIDTPAGDPPANDALATVSPDTLQTPTDPQSFGQSAGAGADAAAPPPVDAVAPTDPALAATPDPIAVPDPTPAAFNWLDGKLGLMSGGQDWAQHAQPAGFGGGNLANMLDAYSKQIAGLTAHPATSG